MRKGYVYFVYSKQTKRVYVGQSKGANLSFFKGKYVNHTGWAERLDYYKSIIDMANKYKVERKEKQYEWLVNTAKYYKGSFSTELIQDIIEIDNTFETIKIETDDHKTLEKTYIRFLYENGYELYNKRLYKNHDWSIDEIDMSIIKIL